MTPDTPRRRFRWEHTAGAAAVLMWLVLALHGAWIKGPSYDEVAHLGDGLAVLRYGDYRMNPEHPPPVKVLSALPVELIVRPALTLEREGHELGPWVDGEQYQWGHYALYFGERDPRWMLFVARLAPVLIGLMGGIVAWMWASEFAGRRGGLIAMSLLLFNPEYLGHARFVTMDVPLLVACGALTLLAWRLWRHPSRSAIALFVIASSILVLVKLPVYICVAVLVLLIAACVAMRRPDNEAGHGFGWRQLLVLAGALVVAVYAMQWAAAGFRFGLESADTPALDGPQRIFDFDGYPEGLMPATIQWLHGLRVLPESSLGIIACLLTTGGRHMFLFGEYSPTGWYHYFFVTTLVKTPLVLLAGLPLAAHFAARRFRGGGRIDRERLLFLLVPLAVILALTIASRLNIGHRHILFVYLPWCVLMGAELARWTYRQDTRKWIAWAAAPALALVCIWVHPHQDTFFNLPAGGNAWKGWRIVRDSNIDWGQDLPLGIREIQRMGYGEANLAYFGMGRPQAYGLERFRFILPSYPHAVYMPEAQPPDPALPSLVSLHVVDDVRRLYPDLYNREPDRVVNSMLIFRPSTELRAPPGS